jgi:hypothetical protein
MKACRNCTSYHALNDEGGHCRFNPPQATMMMTQDLTGQTRPVVLSYFPETAAANWCSQGTEKLQGLVN